MSKKFEITHWSAAKVTDFAFVDKVDQVEIVKEIDNDGKKSKDVLAAIDKERIPDLVKWLNSLGRQKRLEG